MGQEEFVVGQVSMLQVILEAAHVAIGCSNILVFFKHSNGARQEPAQDGAELPRG